MLVYESAPVFWATQARFDAAPQRGQADEDGHKIQEDEAWSVARRFIGPPTELGADPEHNPDRVCDPLVRAAVLERGRLTMNVSSILAGKGREVVTIDPNASLGDAVRLLADKRIGAALILGAGGYIAGIISERDVVRALAERGAGALSEPLSRSMTRKVETCTEGEAVANIMERMTLGKFRHMPVIDQGRLVGIVSIGDIVKHRVEEIERDTVAMRDYILTA
jgi:CBS domain-containing protein